MRGGLTTCKVRHSFGGHCLLLLLPNLHICQGCWYDHVCSAPAFERDAHCLA